MSAKNVLLFLILSGFIFSCKKENDNEIELNSIEKTKNYQYKKVVSEGIDEISLDEQFKVYKYIYVKEKVIEAETNVLFVNGKKEELQIITDMPNGETVEINLINPISLGVIKGMDSYIYTSTSDSKQQVNVYFHNGLEMMGVTFNNENIVYMNTPEYK